MRRTRDPRAALRRLPGPRARQGRVPPRRPGRRDGTPSRPGSCCGWRMTTWPRVGSCSPSWAGFRAPASRPLPKASPTASGGPCLRSDELRKDLAGIGHTTRTGDAFDEGLYDERSTAATYGALLDRARSLLELGEPVVLDASWTDRKWRDAARAVAHETRSDLRELRCDVPAGIARERLAHRAGTGTDASDATGDIAARMATRCRPVAGGNDDRHVGVTRDRRDRRPGRREVMRHSWSRVAARDRRYSTHPVERRELRVVALGDVDAGRFVDSDHEVEEVHGIDVELLAGGRRRPRAPRGRLRERSAKALRSRACRSSWSFTASPGLGAGGRSGRGSGHRCARRWPDGQPRVSSR